MTTMHFSEASLDDVDYATLKSPPPRHLAYPLVRSDRGFSAETHDDESDDNLDDVSLSNGNYSPPAWRRLENGDRFYGNWRGGNDAMVRRAFDKSRLLDPNHDSDIFEAARRTRLPTGSLSPEKGRSPEPDTGDDDTLVKIKSESMPPIKEETDRHPTEDPRQSMMASMPPSATRDNCRCRLLEFTCPAC
ncbi:hypothetical protein RRF57_009047 [Xylaria bambusicola]|uniref:Uncharacterized protein n=1 Tax=Xylaria bambusicola TaxID=326684 RepID=A0AAN7UUB1_9PEZI